MEDTKLVNKIANWNPIGIRTTGRPTNRWRDEEINDLKKIKLRNWIQLIKSRKASNDLMQKTKRHVGLYCQKKECG
jgi:hypothetical protein